MATCENCGKYAYYRVDGSMRCASCNYDSRCYRSNETTGKYKFLETENITEQKLIMKIFKFMTISTSILIMIALATSQPLQHSIGLYIVVVLFSIGLSLPLNYCFAFIIGKIESKIKGRF